VDAQATAPPPAPEPRRRRRWLWITLAVLLALVLAVVGGLTWLVKTPEGARFALDRAMRLGGEGLRYEGLEGSIGGPLRIAVIEVSRPELYARIEGFEMEASPPFGGLLHVHRLGARSVEVRTVDTGEAAKLPVTFAAPYPIRLDAGRVGELRLGDLTREAAAEKDPARKRALMDASRENDLVVREIDLAGEGDKREWRLSKAIASLPQGKVSLSGRVESVSPFALDVKAAIEGRAAERPFKANVNAGGTLKAIDAKLEGEVSGQRATGRAVLEPFATVPVRLLELQARDFDLSKHLEGQPRTRLGLELRLAGQGKAFAGPVRIENAEPGAWDEGRLPFNLATARVVASAEQVDVSDLAVSLAGGGSAAGRATIKQSGVVAELALADVDLAALHGSLQKTRVRGTASVSGDRNAQRFDVALADPRFQVDARGAVANEQVELEAVTVKSGAGSVTASGTVGLAGEKAFRLEGRAQRFDPSAFVKAAKGDLNFSFLASGTMEGTPAGEARIEIAPSTFAGLPASGRVHVAGDASRLARGDVNVTLGEARLAARGSFGRQGDALDVKLHAPNLSLLAKPFGVAAAGKLDAEGRLTGTFKSPAGTLSLRGSNLALPGNVRVRDVSFRGQAGVEPGSPIEATVRAQDVAVGGDSPPTPFAHSIDASLRGTRLEHRLEARARMTRESELAIALQGGLDARAREAAWNGRVESFGMTGRGAFRLLQPTPLHASASRIELGDAQLRGDWGEARMLLARWTPRSLELKGSTPGIEIQNLARSFRLGGVPRSNLVIAGDWDIRGAETFEGTLNLHRLRGDLRLGEPALELGLKTLELKASAVRGRAQATFTLAGDRVGSVRGEGSGLIVRGDTGWEFAAASPVQAKFVAEHTNLEVLAPWLGPDARLGGRFNADVTVSGTGNEPRVAGMARATDLTLREPQSGFEITQGQVAVRMEGRTLTIERLTATTPWNPPAAAREHLQDVTLPASGTITAEGRVDLGKRTGALVVKATDAVLTQLQTRFLAVTGEARLEAGEGGMVARGAFKADAGWIGALESAPPSVSEDVVVVRAATGVPAEPAPKSDAIRIEARFDLGQNLHFVGRGIDTQLVGDIQVSGPPTALKATGTIRTQGGTYNGYGQKLTIERGVLRFAGPVDNPQLSVLALRKGLPVEAGVEVLGTVSRPRVRLVSTPDVPEPEKLSWLVLGRGPSELAPGDASVLLAAATSMLGRNNPGSDLGKRLGLDEVRIGRADTNSILGVLPQSTVAGKTGSASAAEVVSVGKKLTRDLHLTYEQGLADAEGALRLSWQITRQFQLLARAGFLPGLDAVYRWSFK